jgi:AGCS family alanine or glycine:cation symporter
MSISLFVLTTVIGNSFNGIQSFTALMKNRWVHGYIAFTLAVIFVGSLLKVQLIWEMMDTLLTLVVIPNLIGLVILACKRPDVLKIR